MPNLSEYILRLAFLVTLIGGADSLNVAHADTYEKAQSPQAMSQHVEDRIQTLHDKLGITSTQETEWSAVAQAMRDNESAVGQLIQVRHQDPANMTAIDDLQSYENITQAHADGLKKLIVAFQTLYTDMPDHQKKIADEVFSRYEGHTSDKKHT